VSCGVVSDLDQRHDVEACVELAVAGAGEPVADDIARGHLDRGRAGVGRERRLRACRPLLPIGKQPARLPGHTRKLAVEVVDLPGFQAGTAVHPGPRIRLQR
jgi:hypothetical protein